MVTSHGLYVNDETWDDTAYYWNIGLIIFLLRNLLNDIRTRTALAQTQGVPDAIDDSLPDPFEDHVLLKHPLNQHGKLFALTEDDLSISYFVDASPEHDWWKIVDAEDQEVCRVKAEGGISSFIFNVSLPKALTIYKDEKIFSRIFPRFSFASPTIHITKEDDTAILYIIKGQGIYMQEQLIGRVYTLRNSLYLDVQKKHLNESILAYFVTLS